ncbi:insulin-like peptide precursor II precursor [Aplysia californica]|uniref:Insulin-like peptide II n=1 Tax=Aplysia californica TaxID=6500 RepID=Q8T7J6_APLCA|nr:insulin-like peptide precursor II precursor [Aplysia californica]AAL99711.2 insulin-like peptide precursor II [Aplysia californica]
MEPQSTLDLCVTLTLLVSTFGVMTAQGQLVCVRDSRPHPRGICGSRLTRAHNNLCFLLSRTYPEHFPGKRSASPELQASQNKRVPNQSLIERIYSIPLSVLADLDLSRDDWGSLVFRRPLAGPALARYPEGESEESGGDPEASAKLNRFTAMVLDSMAGRRLKRGGTQSNMVCDCCYHMCSPRQLATYC